MCTTSNTCSCNNIVVLFTNLKNLPDPIALPFIALCKMAYNGLQDDQLGFSTSQLPQSLQGCPGCKGTKPDLLGLMSGSKSFTAYDATATHCLVSYCEPAYTPAPHSSTAITIKQLHASHTDTAAVLSAWCVVC